MTLTSDLEHQFNTLHASLPPEVSKTIISTTSAFKESYSPSAAPEIGDPLPPFTLTAADGTPTTTASLLSFPEGIEGYLLIAFYRGSWCPFCNIFLRSLASHLQEFKEAGVKLVAVSPELPDTNSETVEELGLEFPVLTDRGNGLAKKLGILYKQPESMKGVLRDFGVDFEKSNGDGRYEAWVSRSLSGKLTFKVPVPAVFLVDAKGIVRERYIEPDFSKRLEPSVALEWVADLRGKS